MKEDKSLISYVDRTATFLSCCVREPYIIASINRSPSLYSIQTFTFVLPPDPEFFSSFFDRFCSLKSLDGGNVATRGQNGARFFYIHAAQHHVDA